MQKLTHSSNVNLKNMNTPETLDIAFVGSHIKNGLTMRSCNNEVSF